MIIRRFINCDDGEKGDVCFSCKSESQNVDEPHPMTIPSILVQTARLYIPTKKC